MSYTIEQIKSWIIFEDHNIIVFNKPRGLLLQQDPSKDEDSLDKLVLVYLNYQTGFKTCPVHRLDKDTSGVCMFAKNSQTMTYFSTLFQEHKDIEKHYLTLVSGEVLEDGEVNAPIRKSFEKKKMIIAPLSSGAKQAITQYKVIKSINGYSLLDINLLTGRTHQIRVHMSYIRHHVVGDKKYGDYKINNLFKNQFNFENQFLHAKQVTFKELTGKFAYLSNKSFNADVPDELKNILIFLSF